MVAEVEGRDTSDREIRERMRRRLEEVEWTMVQLAEATGASYSNTRNWMSGGNPPIRPRGRPIRP